jgi:beta-N-acetylhexosaminidase
MLCLASKSEPDLLLRVAGLLGLQLRKLGFTLDFAPVLDVHSRAENPVIGDRAFGTDAATVCRMAEPFIEGLQAAGILACGKHFPGHGDTTKDSHFDLPVVERSRQELEAIELPPFRMAARAYIETMMSAHVVYTALDPDVPATLSHAICTDLLRRDVGFEGVLFSDDLEMKAIVDRWGIGEAAVLAVRAGCDALLVCWSEERQEEALAALVRETESSPAFAERVREAYARVMDARRAFPPRPRLAPEVDSTLEMEARELASVLSTLGDRA